MGVHSKPSMVAGVPGPLLGVAAAAARALARLRGPAYGVALVYHRIAAQTGEEGRERALHRAWQLRHVIRRDAVAAQQRRLRADQAFGGWLVDWRRLALAIEDFRQANGITDRVSALGTGAGLPGRDELVTRVSAFRRERGLSRGLER